MEIDVPGIEKENIIIDYQNGYLTVTVKQEEKNIDYIRKERIYGEYNRSFYVGSISEIEAQLKNGILIIKFSTIENEKLKKIIEIK